MKKLVLFVYIMVLAIGLSACSGVDNAVDESSVDTTAEEMSQADMDISETKETEIIEESETEKTIHFYRDNMKIFGRLYLPEGEGPFPVVIFVGGMSASYTYTQGYAKNLAENGIAGVVFDCIGYCNPSPSDGALTDMSVLTAAKDVEVVIDEISSFLEIDSENIFLWGHSLGGLITTYAATQNSKDVQGLICVEPSYQMRDQFEEMFPEGKEIPDVIYSPYVGKIFVEDIFSFDIYDKMPEYDGKVLLFQGTVAPSIGAEAPEYLERAAETFPSVQVEAVEGADHGFSGDAGVQMLEKMITFINDNMNE